VSAELLLDTGALVSILDRSQRHHDAFLDVYRSWHGPVVSTEAVLTEATHVLMRLRGGAVAVVEWFRAGGATLVPPSQSSLARAGKLMAKYADLPMDYADASLVVLAEELRTKTVLTTDRRDFSVYRFRGRTRFEVLPKLP
jgi:hypothetical protein